MEVLKIVPTESGGGGEDQRFSVSNDKLYCTFNISCHGVITRHLVLLGRVCPEDIVLWI